MHDKSRSIFCKVFIKSLGYWYFLRRYDIFAPEAYIRCEMTPTSVGGEQQNYISGGIQSPI